MANNDFTANTGTGAFEYIGPLTSPFFKIAGEALPAGAVVALDNNAGAANVFLADADNASAARQKPVGFVPTAFAITALATVVTTGEVPVPDAQWISVPAAADVGKIVYLAATAGKITFAPLTELTVINATLVRVGVVSAGGAGTSKVAVQIGDAVATETTEMLAMPEARYTADGTRADHTVLEGASFRITRRVQFNRMIARNTASGAAQTLKVLIYQTVNGLSGTAALKATVAAFAVPGVAGDLVMTPAEGIVTLEPGIFYVLFGRSSAAGSVTMQTWTNITVSLWNSNMPPAGTIVHPTTFLTATLASAASPATFNPLESPTGDAIVSTLNLALVMRFYRV